MGVYLIKYIIEYIFNDTYVFTFLKCRLPCQQTLQTTFFNQCLTRNNFLGQIFLITIKTWGLSSNMRQSCMS